MSGIATAIIGGAVIGGAASVYAGGKAADAAESAAGTASSTELEMYYQSREDMAPWRTAGQEGLNMLTGEPIKDAEGNVTGYGANGLLAGPGEFTASPGYDFVKSEAENAMTNRLSGQGKVRSGAAVKESGRYAAGLASQEYGNFWNRYQDKLRGYQSLAGIGQQTSSAMAQNALSTGQSVAGNQAAGIMNAGNAQSAGIMGVANAANQGVGNYLNYQLMNKMYGGGTSGTGTVNAINPPASGSWFK